MENKKAKRRTPIMRHGWAWLLSAVVVVVLWIAWSWLRLDGAVQVAIGDDLAALAARSPPGTVFRLAPGIHRVADIRPKHGQVFDGAGGAIISGAMPLAGFGQDGTAWRTAGPQPLAPSHGSCDPKRWPAPHTDGCRYREALFVDGRLMPRVFEREAIDGKTWFQDRASGDIVVGFDPAGRTIELSHADTAFAGDAENVAIHGLTIERFASVAQHGAIQGDRTRGWRIEKDVIRDNSGGGVRIGDGMKLVGNKVLSNGQIGVVGIGNDVVVDGNDIGGNNTHGYATAWEAGGTKFVKTERLLVARNCVHDNNGPGLWTDIDNRDARISDNISVGNTGAGIFHEISGRALIEGNLSAENGSAEDSPWGSQILVSGSIDTMVRNNRVVVAGDFGHGIFVVEEGRVSASKTVHDGPTYAAQRNVVKENEILFAGPHGMYGFSGHDPNFGPLHERNRFQGNTVETVTISPRFVDGGPPTMSQSDKPVGRYKTSRLASVGHECR